MSDLDNIVDIVISRDVETISRTGFGIPAIISEFTTAKTTVAFERARFYASLAEMLTDGWTAYDAEYKAAQVGFAQDPKPEKIMIGRIDSGDANLTAALDAIQLEEKDWYGFMIISTKITKVVFDADFVTGNSIVATINGVAVTAVPFNTDQATTMSDLETQIETDIPGSAVVIDPTRTLLITFADGSSVSFSAVITGGASQAGYAVSKDNTGVNQAYKDAAAWAELHVKLFSFISSDADILTAVTTDIFSFMQTQGYDRTFYTYHPNSQTEETPSWFEFGQMCESFPFNAGASAWAYKTIAGVATYTLTEGQETIVRGKFGGTYLTVSAKDITQEGKVASGEWIDIIRGTDWLQSRIQEDIFIDLTSERKIPFTDEGVSVFTGTTEKVLNEGATNERPIVNKDSIDVTAPKVADVSSEDKGNRLLPDINFTATYQGAIIKTQIRGVISV